MQLRVGLAIEPVDIEKDSYVAAGLGLPVGVFEPRCFFEQDRLDVLVFAQRRFESLGLEGSPSLEDFGDFRVACSDVPCEAIGIQTVEGLLAAIVGILHEIGECQDGIPSGLRGHLQGQRLVLYRVGAGRVD